MAKVSLPCHVHELMQHRELTVEGSRLSFRPFETNRVLVVQRQLRLHDSSGSGRNGDHGYPSVPSPTTKTATATRAATTSASSAASPAATHADASDSASAAVESPSAAATVSAFAGLERVGTPIPRKRHADAFLGHLGNMSPRLTPGREQPAARWHRADDARGNMSRPRQQPRAQRSLDFGGLNDHLPLYDSGSSTPTPRSETAET